ncbi:hypothetical protein, partial [Acinetobacter pittii]|uniref:hypothetical protein n=1 Tax=Acinetobacter pittii TaxID=48296 RepID=UPI00202A2DB1
MEPEVCIPPHGLKAVNVDRVLLLIEVTSNTPIQIPNRARGNDMAGGKLVINERFNPVTQKDQTYTLVVVAV